MLYGGLYAMDEPCAYLPDGGDVLDHPSKYIVRPHLFSDLGIPGRFVAGPFSNPYVRPANCRRHSGGYRVGNSMAVRDKPPCPGDVTAGLFTGSFLILFIQRLET